MEQMHFTALSFFLAVLDCGVSFMASKRSPLSLLDKQSVRTRSAGLPILSKLPSLRILLLFASVISGVDGCTCSTPQYPECIFTAGANDGWCKGPAGQDQWCNVLGTGCILTQCGATKGSHCTTHHSSYNSGRGGAGTSNVSPPPSPPSPPPPAPPPPSPPTWRRSQTADKRLADSKLGKAPSCMLRVSATPPGHRRFPPCHVHPMLHNESMTCSSITTFIPSRSIIRPGLTTIPTSGMLVPFLILAPSTKGML